MDNKLYFKILKELHKSGIGKMTNITHLLDKVYLKAQVDTLLDTKARENRIIAFLNIMNTNGHIISYSNKSVSINDKKWIKPIHFEAALSATGFSYYREYRKSQITFWGIWISIAGVLLTAISIYLGHKDIKNEPLNDPPMSKVSNKPMPKNHSLHTPK